VVVQAVHHKGAAMRMKLFTVIGWGNFVCEIARLETALPLVGVLQLDEV
jgi:hypothetical protein